MNTFSYYSLQDCIRDFKYCEYNLSSHWRDGMVGEECQKWSATGEYQLEWKGRLQDGCKTSIAARVRDGGTDEKTGGRYGGDTVENNLQFSLGVTGMDKTRNHEYIRGTAQVGWFGDKTRETPLRWSGRVRRKDVDNIGSRLLRMGLLCEWKGGTPNRKCMDAVRETWQWRKFWRMIQNIGPNVCGNPLWTGQAEIRRSLFEMES